MSYTQARHVTINHCRHHHLKPGETMLFDPKDTGCVFLYTSLTDRFPAGKGNGQC